VEHFERLHMHYFKVFDVFRNAGHPEIDNTLARFYDRVANLLRETKQTKLAEVLTILCRRTS
jgi:hypothetical protein